MDRFQTVVLEAINHRESGSWKNWITMHNSFHTKNDFTSEIFMHGTKVATVFYKHDVHDTRFNILGGKRGDDLKDSDKWEVERIAFYTSAMKKIKGTMPTRYRNFLSDHYPVYTIFEVPTNA